MKNAKDNSDSMQTALLESIKSRLNPSISLVDALADCLSISNDAAYRRIRGEKLLDLNEMGLLCRRYNISMDAVLAIPSNGLIFNYSPLNLENKEVYISYMQQVNRNLEVAAREKNSSITFSALDIPVYHFMPFRELTLFKLFSWNSGLYNASKKFEPFFESFSSNELFSIFDSIALNYQKIPSLELWTAKTVEPLIRLIDYYVQIGSFENSNTPRLLYQQVIDLLDNLSQNASAGRKGNPINGVAFDMYLSDIDLDNSFMLIKSDQQQLCVLKLFTINSISTSNTLFCDETERWFSNLIKKSQCISRMSQKEHYKFFQGMKMKVIDLLNKVN